MREWLLNIPNREFVQAVKLEYTKSSRYQLIKGFRSSKALYVFGS
jgi:hypothetical protein